jgi:insulysin
MAALLADPANSMMFLTSKKLDDSTLPLKEKWYNIQYSSEKYSEAFMNRLKNPQPADNGKKLDLPPPNTLLPTNFDIINDEAQFSQKPVLIEVQDGAEVWYKQDQQFKRPKGIVNLTIYHNDDGNVTATPAKQLFHHVWRACLSEFMREFKYMADCAGLDCSINSSNPAVNITWSGYNSSLPSYTEETAKMFQKFAQAEIADIFALKKEELLMKYNNHYLQQTFRLAWGEVSSKVVPTEFECKQMTELLKNYSYDDFCAHRANFLKRGRQVWGFFGNITKDDALASFKSV